MDGSIAMAVAAVAGGVTTMVATPHIREDYPFPVALLEPRLAEVRQELADRGIELSVAGGAEIAITQVAELDDETLKGLCLGRGHYVLIESPYSHATGLLESTLFDLQV